MSTIRRISAAGLAVSIAAAIALSGCSQKLRSVLVPNALPVVSITSAPIDTNVVCTPDPVRSCYSLIINWVGYDPDGRVDHYLLAVDPPTVPGADTTWQITRNNEERLLFTSSQALARRSTNDPAIARDFHVFVIKAVDNSGMEGPVVSRAFFSFTQAPDVFIIDPVPSCLNTPTLTPSIRISWSGSDADGVFNTRPVKYKFIMLNQSSEFPLDKAIRFPDSLRAYYAPDFVGWDSLGGDTTTFQYTNLTPDQEYMFVVVGFDEAGAYSPIFRCNQNMFLFRVGFAGALGPKITVFNEFFDYTWRGGYCPCPSTEFFIEIPADRRVTFNWRADVPDGVELESFRWALDIADVYDQTPRSGVGDLAHWSSPSLNVRSATLGPFEGGIDPPEEHRFYLEAVDNVGLKSLGVIRFQVVRSSLTPGQMLIVKDMRLLPDGIPRNGNCTAPPTAGFWPTSAELDTFLFARGGVPWRCYPAGTMSTPGLFSGYSYDTVGTRTGKKDLTIRLAKLGRYEFVIWVIDQLSANSFKDGNDLVSPQTALRYISGPGKFNTLGAYIKQGGKVWLVGGGGGFAVNIPWNDVTNDSPTIKFSNTSTRRELEAGRFMYDIAHWQSEFRTGTNPVAMTRYLGRFERGKTDPELSYTNYFSELPPLIDFKTAATDPLPPQRNSGQFYQRNSSIEYLQIPNRIIENVSTDPESLIEVSTLDSLYKVVGGGTPTATENAHNVIMTYYHGPAVKQGFVHTGFNIWLFKRTQCRALVDFVLKRIWGLQPVTGLASGGSVEGKMGRPPAGAITPRPVTAAEAGGSVGIRRREVATRRAPTP